MVAQRSNKEAVPVPKVQDPICHEGLQRKLLNMRRRCPICLEKSRPFLRHKDFFGRKVQLRKCVNCGHGFYSLRYSEAQFEKIYADDYADGYIGETTEDQALREREYHNDVHRMLSQAPELSERAISVLDIGCSSGGFLDAMPNTWNKSGTEVNSVYLERLAQERPSWNIAPSLSHFGGQKFDLVTLRGVIEHIQDHGELLDFLQGVLSPGGYVFITATPDFSSSAAILYKEMWKQIVCPEHVHQFTSASIVLLLARSGLSPVSITHPYLDSVYADPNKDGKQFLRNFSSSNRKSSEPALFQHAFPGNMMTGLFRVVDV